MPTAKSAPVRPKLHGVALDPANAGRRGGLALKAAHADDADYFRNLGRKRGLAKARNHSAAVNAIREAAARGEIG